jgi:hypothetical protein
MFVTAIQLLAYLLKLLLTTIYCTTYLYISYKNISNIILVVIKRSRYVKISYEISIASPVLQAYWLVHVLSTVQFSNFQDLYHH